MIVVSALSIIVTKARANLFNCDGIVLPVLNSSRRRSKMSTFESTAIQWWDDARDSRPRLASPQIRSNRRASGSWSRSTPPQHSPPRTAVIEKQEGTTIAIRTNKPGRLTLLNRHPGLGQPYVLPDIPPAPAMHADSRVSAKSFSRLFSEPSDISPGRVFAT